MKTLLLALAALYLVECLIVVRREGFVFWSWVGRASRLTLGRNLLGAVDWGLFLTPPIPPLGRVFESYILPISFCPTGIGSSPPCDFGREQMVDPAECFVEYDAISALATDGPHLIVNDQRFARCGSDVQARFVAKLVRRLINANPSKREGTIKRAIANHFDERAASRDVATATEPAKDVRLVANFLFAYLFVVTPVIVMQRGLAASWVTLLVGMVSLWLLAVVLAWRSSIKLFADQKLQRRRGVLVLLLTPMAAIRAHDFLTRHRLAAYHPVAVAHVLCDELRFADFAQDILRDLTFPMRRANRNDDSAVWRASTWTRSCLREACEAMLVRAGLSPDQLLSQPAPIDDQGVSFCPRCRSEFVLRAGQCSDCGISLVGFDVHTDSNPSENAAGESPVSAMGAPGD